MSVRLFLSLAIIVSVLGHAFYASGSDLPSDVTEGNIIRRPSLGNIESDSDSSSESDSSDHFEPPAQPPELEKKDSKRFSLGRLLRKRSSTNVSKGPPQSPRPGSTKRVSPRKMEQSVEGRDGEDQTGSTNTGVSFGVIPVLDLTQLKKKHEEAGGGSNVRAHAMLRSQGRAKSARSVREQYVAFANSSGSATRYGKPTSFADLGRKNSDLIAKWRQEQASEQNPAAVKGRKLGSKILSPRSAAKKGNRKNTPRPIAGNGSVNEDKSSMSVQPTNPVYGLQQQLQQAAQKRIDEENEKSMRAFVERQGIPKGLDVQREIIKDGKILKVPDYSDKFFFDSNQPHGLNLAHIHAFAAEQRKNNSGGEGLGSYVYTIQVMLFKVQALKAQTSLSPLDTEKLKGMLLAIKAGEEKIIELVGQDKAAKIDLDQLPPFNPKTQKIWEVYGGDTQDTTPH